MAAIVVGAVIQNLGSLLIEEIKSMRNVRKNFESIKIELEIIGPFLKNADEKAVAQELDQGQSNEAIQIWVRDIREEAYHIEDVIDEFTFSVAKLHHGNGLYGVLARFWQYMKMLKLRYKIASDIKDIMSSLVEIDERRRRYDLKEEGSKNEMNFKRVSYGVRSYFTEEGQIVGNKSIRNELIDWLVDERTKPRVLALVGAGGLGKTTLVADVYKWPVARNCVDCYAWLEVGRAYNEEDVFRNLLRQFSRSRKEPPQEDIDTMDSRELIELLRTYLGEKRYMVVFDDVRQADFWKYVEHALPDNGKASRIVITTRNRAVPDYIANIIPGSGDHIHVRVLEPLPPEEAWQLFCRKAFPDGVCPVDLEKLSDNILAKCDGLPIAIVAIGGLLSKKNKDDEWRELLNNLGSELKRDIHLKDCNRILCESYNDLPQPIKPCLLYFTLFPPRESVECERLIRLWIAEGFVQPQDNKSKLHEEADTYLTELISRSLVQVSETSIDGKATSVRVHELMHEIILEKAKQFGFSQVLKEQEQDSTEKRRTRRITVHKSTNKVVKSVQDSKVRSMFLFEIDELPGTFICTLAIANFKLMKVLDFQGAPLHDNLPKEVGNLFNLRYLSLRRTKVKVLPTSIGKLFNLDTLDLRHTLVSELPNEIRNLKKLRCLLGGQSDQLDHTSGEAIKVQEAIGHLTELQELAFVEASFKVVKELGKLRKLKKLGLRVTKVKGMDLCTSISKMPDLNSLDVESVDQDEDINLQSIASPPLGLDLLCLTGILKKLPDWISNLHSLVKLRLVQSGLTDDPFKVLHSLPNLMELAFIEAHNCEHLHFAEGWFPKLKNLILVGFKGLKSMIIDDGAMPLIQSLQIESCPLLKVPTGISNLKNLIELILIDMPKEFADEIVSSKYYCKVFASRIVEGKQITEINNPPLVPELRQESKDDDEEKDEYQSVSPELQKERDDSGERTNNSEEDSKTTPVAPVVQQENKESDENKSNIERDFTPPLLKLQKSSKEDDQGKRTSEKDYSPPVQHEFQQGSKDDEEGKNSIEKDYIPPIIPELQQASEDGKGGKNIIEKDHSPAIWSEIQQASRAGEEDKDIAGKDYTPVDLQKSNKEGEEGKDITGEDYSSDLQQESKDDKEVKDISQKELQQESKDDKEVKDISQKELQQVNKVNEEGKNVIEKDYTTPIASEVQQPSQDGKGKDIIEKAYGEPALPELPQTSKDDARRKEITPPIKPEPNQPTKELAKNIAAFWQRQSSVLVDGEGKNITGEKDRDRLGLPKLQQTSNDNEEGKDASKQDYSPPVQHDLKVNELLRRVAIRKPHNGVTRP